MLEKEIQYLILWSDDCTRQREIKALSLTTLAALQAALGSFEVLSDPERGKRLRKQSLSVAAATQELEDYVEDQMGTKK
jgi:hypothetical protein